MLLVVEAPQSDGYGRQIQVASKHRTWLGSPQRASSHSGGIAVIGSDTDAIIAPWPLGTWGRRAGRGRGRDLVGGGRQVAAQAECGGCGCGAGQDEHGEQPGAAAGAERGRPANGPEQEAGGEGQ